MPGRVVRQVDHDHPCRRGDLAAQLVDVDRPAVRPRAARAGSRRRRRHGRPRTGSGSRATSRSRGRRGRPARSSGRRSPPRPRRTSAPHRRRSCRTATRSRGGGAGGPWTRCSRGRGRPTAPASRRRPWPAGRPSGPPGRPRRTGGARRRTPSGRSTARGRSRRCARGHDGAPCRPRTDRRRRPSLRPGLPARGSRGGSMTPRRGTRPRPGDGPSRSPSRRGWIRRARPRRSVGRQPRSPPRRRRCAVRARTPFRHPASRSTADPLARPAARSGNRSATSSKVRPSARPTSVSSQRSSTSMATFVSRRAMAAAVAVARRLGLDTIRTSAGRIGASSIASSAAARRPAAESGGSAWPQYRRPDQDVAACRTRTTAVTTGRPPRPHRTSPCHRGPPRRRR